MKNNTEVQSQVLLRIGFFERQRCTNFKAEEDIQACISKYVASKTSTESI